MGRKSVADLQEELDQERADNERLHAKVQQLREVIADYEAEDEDVEEDEDEE